MTVPDIQKSYSIGQGFDSLLIPKSKRKTRQVYTLEQNKEEIGTQGPLKRCLNAPSVIFPAPGDFTPPIPQTLKSQKQRHLSSEWGKRTWDHRSCGTESTFDIL